MREESFNNLVTTGMSGKPLEYPKYFNNIYLKIIIPFNLSVLERSNVTSFSFFYTSVIINKTLVSGSFTA